MVLLKYKNGVDLVLWLAVSKGNTPTQETKSQLSYPFIKLYTDVRLLCLYDGKK